MDLSVSPDRDARCCYLVVLLCALVAARVQVYQRLQQRNPNGIWLEPGTWAIFFIYLCLPLGLFWLMDRYGAVHDTSLFAAVLIGAAYPALLSGNLGGLKSPVDAQSLQKPLDSFIDYVTRRITARNERNRRRIREIIIPQMLANSELNKWIEERAATASGNTQLASDIADINKSILDAAKTTADSAGASELLASERAKERRALKYYVYASADSDFEKDLVAKRYLKEKWLRGITTFARMRRVVVFMLAVALAVLVRIAVLLQNKTVCIWYNVWRIEKPNNSPQDLYRARLNLGGYLQAKNAQQEAERAIVGAIATPGLSTERVDLLIETLLENRSAMSPRDELPELLVRALRASNNDAKAHVQESLRLLAEETGRPVDKKLAEWNPAAAHSLREVETAVHAWEAYWSANTAASMPASATSGTTGPQSQPSP
jgi:hypothetical protein